MRLTHKDAASSVHPPRIRRLYPYTIHRTASGSKQYCTRAPYAPAGHTRLLTPTDGLASRTEPLKTKSEPPSPQQKPLGSKGRLAMDDWSPFDSPLVRECERGAPTPPSLLDDIAHISLYTPVASGSVSPAQSGHLQMSRVSRVESAIEIVDVETGECLKPVYRK